MNLFTSKALRRLLDAISWAVMREHRRPGWLLLDQKGQLSLQAQSALLPVVTERVTSRIKVLAGVLLLLFLMACLRTDPCVDQTFSRQGSHTLMEWVDHDAHPEEAGSPPPLDDLVLYLDTSLSMQGYADPSGEFEYGRALEAIRDVVDELEPRHSILYRRVADEVGPLEASDQTLWRAARQSSFYTGGESNLGGAIRTFRLSDPALDEGGGIARCHILVTDGVQHLRSGHDGDVCVSGNDPRCVNEALRDLIRDGWGAHIFGIRSRFDGPIFSEVAQQWLSGRYRARGLDAVGRYRPFLILLFTSSADYMPHLVARLRSQLRRAGVRDELIGELPLTLRLVEATDLEFLTDVYKIVDEFGSELENPLVHHVEPEWREDVDGRSLGDNVEIFEYLADEELTPTPFAIHITANVDFTEAGRALFSRGSADVGSLLRPVRVSEVTRPENWYHPPAALEVPEPTEEVSTGIQGTGLLSDAGGDEGSDMPGNVLPNEFDGSAESEEVGSEGPETWPPLERSKKLQLPESLEEYPDAPLELLRPMECTLNGGCHLVARWSQRGLCFPVSLLRLEASLDPEKIPLPSWISEWSTPSDTSLESANRLLNLNRLVRGLLENEQIARQGLEPWYLVLWPTTAR